MENNMNTPYYVIRKGTLDGLMTDLKESLDQYWNNYTLGYSFKTNSLPWLVKYMHQAGYYAETVSADEYEMAVKCGYGSKIIYSGPVKTKESFLNALSNGCIVNIDSKRELRWLDDFQGRASAGLRVNFDLEEYCSGESQMGDEGGRFGFSYEAGELESAISELKKKHVHLSGLHLHCSSKTRSIGIYKAIAEICCEIVKKYQLDLEYLDIGGGFFGGVPGKPAFHDYFREVSQILRPVFDPERTRLIVEPGMSLIGASMDYVTSVIDVKKTNRNVFVTIDGSRTNIDPLMRKTGYTYDIMYKTVNRKLADKQVICGFTCMEADRLITLNDTAELEEGDKIIFRKVGAYTLSLTPLFIEMFPDVYIENDGTFENVRSRWTVDRILKG